MLRSTSKGLSWSGMSLHHEKGVEVGVMLELVAQDVAEGVGKRRERVAHLEDRLMIGDLRVALADAVLLEHLARDRRGIDVWRAGRVQRGQKGELVRELAAERGDRLAKHLGMLLLVLGMLQEHLGMTDAAGPLHVIRVAVVLLRRN